MTFLGFPLGYYFCVQGSLIAFVALIWIQNWRQDSIDDEVLRLLARRGFKLPATVVKRDWRKPFAGHKAAVEAWLAIYRRPRDHWDLYDLAEKLMDMEMLFQRWRFDHVSAVERVIGHQPGTGGSSGVAFLKKALDLRFFPDLYEVRNRLIYG
jgi:tryptophan 2,3-dioxygenase